MIWAAARCRREATLSAQQKSMNGAGVQQARVASGAHRGLHWPGAAQAEAHRMDKPIRVQEGAPAGVQFPKPGVVNIRAVEFAKAHKRIPRASSL